MMDEMKANFEKLLTQYPSGMYVNSLLASKNFGVKRDYIAVGNGAAELIKSIMEKDNGIIGVVSPTFEEYPNRYSSESTVRYMPEKEDFRYDENDLIKYFTANPADTILIVNPDNPTGNYIKYEGIIKLLDWAKSENKKVIIALEQLEVHLSSSAEKNDTVKLLNEIKELQAKKTELETEISRCDDQIHSAQFEKEQFKRQLNKVLLKIASNADTSDDNVRIIEYSTMILDVMHEFVRRLQAQKVGILEKNITSCFKFLAQKQAIITSIIIDPETLDITLKDYKGGVLLKDQLSAGEKQMFAISILWGLALSSGYKLPVIIDTPMARLDSAHRSNFINKYLPNASSQVIVLSTDEEINGKYLDDIKAYVNKAYTLIYNDSEKCSTIEPGYFGGGYNDL